MSHSKTLVQQAKEYDREQASREEIGKDMVEKALLEKLQLVKETALELEGLSLISDFFSLRFFLFLILSYFLIIIIYIL